MAHGKQNARPLAPFSMVLRKRPTPPPPTPTPACPPSPRTPRKTKRARLSKTPIPQTPKRTPRTRRVPRSGPATPTGRHHPYAQKAATRDGGGDAAVLPALPVLPELPEEDVDDRMDVETVRGSEMVVDTTWMERTSAPRAGGIYTSKSSRSAMSVDDPEELASSIEASFADASSAKQTTMPATDIEMKARSLPPMPERFSMPPPTWMPRRPLRRDVSMTSVTSMGSDVSMASSRTIRRGMDVSMESMASTSSDASMATVRPRRRSTAYIMWQGPSSQGTIEDTEMSQGSQATIPDIDMLQGSQESAADMMEMSQESQVSLADSDVSMASARSDVTMRPASPPPFAQALGTVAEEPEEEDDFVSAGYSDGDDDDDDSGSDCTARRCPSPAVSDYTVTE